MKKRRFSRHDWVALGLAELAARGPEAVKLEAICDAAGMTRGSFYHHFKDHGAFLTALAEDWFDTQTRQVANELETTGAHDDEADRLTRAAMATDYRLELGMRELGRRVPDIGAVVARADHTRLTVLADLYRRRFGVDAARAEDLAFLEYAAFSGLILLDPEIPTDRQETLARLYDAMISRALGPPDGGA